MIFTFAFVSPMSAQWVDPNGPFGTTLTSLAVSGSSLFAGTTVGGVYISTDNASSWTAINNGLTTNYVTALATSGSDVFAGTYSNGVFISTNYGGSWNPASTGLPSKAIQVLAVAGGDLLAGTAGGGVYLSTNNGASWNSASAGLTDLSITAITASGTYLFAGTANGLVFFSTNNGTLWTLASTGLPVGEVTSIAVLGTNTPPTNLMVGMFNAIYTTTNMGANWIASTTGLPSSIGSTSFAIIGTNIFAGTYDGVFLSTNNGTSWNAVDTGLPANPDIAAMAVIGTDVFAGMSNLGVFRSTNNGTNWTSPNTGFPANNSVNALYVFGANLYVGSARGVYRSTDNGSDWILMSNGLPEYNMDVTALISVGTYLFAGTQSDGSGIDGDNVFLSTDSGASWNDASAGITPNSNVTAFAAFGHNLFAATAAHGVFLSQDNGTSWTGVNNGLPADAAVNIFSVPINALAVIGTNLFAGTSFVSNGVSVGGGVYLSKDSGGSWTDVSSGLPTQPGPDDVNALAVIGTTLFAGTSASQPQESTGPVFISTNNGTTWTSASSGFPTNAYDATLLAVGKNLYAGATLGGVLVSTDNGTSWTDAGSPPTAGDALAANPSYLFIGHSQTIWRLGRVINNHPEPARDTQSVVLKSMGTVNVTLSDDTVGLVAHRINFVNTSNAAIVVDSAVLTNLNAQFAIAQLFPGIPDTVLPNDTFGMIVVFGGDDTGGIYRDTLVLSVGDPTSFYVYLTGKSFSTSRVLQNLSSASAVLRNYPNPFSQQSTIEFKSSEEGYAEVTVMNLLGSEVARLFSGELNAGDHTFSWNASGMSPGMYECIVRMNGSVERTPMLLSH